MKVTRKETNFKPLIITLETEKELNIWLGCFLVGADKARALKVPDDANAIEKMYQQVSEAAGK